MRGNHSQKVKPSAPNTITLRPCCTIVHVACVLTVAILPSFSGDKKAATRSPVAPTNMLANVVPNPIGKKAIGLVFRLFNFGAHTTQMTNTPSIKRNQSLGSETTTCPAIIAPIQIQEQSI